MSSATLPPVPGMPLHSPTRTPYDLHRPDLVASLINSITTKQVVVLQAPAGYGKTSLLLECLQALSLPAVYLHVRSTFPDTLDPSHTDLYRVSASAPESIAQAAHIYGETKRLDFALNAIATAVTREEQTAVVMLDDYPIAEDAAQIPGLEAFLLELRPYLRMIISSRGSPDLPLARWAAEGRLALYSQHDLRFSVDESRRMISVGLGREPHPAEVEFLEQNLAGWALGLSLITGVLASPDAPPQHGRLLPGIAAISTINQYLEYEVMQVGAVSPAVRDFMEQTSVLPDLGIDICNSFMGIENSGEILRGLQHRGFYISNLDDGATIYAYHPVFRRFLQKQLREHGGAHALEAAHLRAAGVFEQYRLWRRAIWYYSLANQHETAVRLIEAHANDLLERPATTLSIEYVRPRSIVDPVSDLLERLDNLPPEMVEARPFLLIVKARALLLHGKYKSARRLWRIVLELLQSEVDALTAAPSDLVGEEADARRMHIESLLQIMWPEDRPGQVVCSEALHSLSLALGDFADTLKAVAVEEAALTVAHGIPHAATRLSLETQILFRLARLYLYRADLRSLRSAIDRLCEIGADGTKDDAGFTWFCSEGRMRLEIISGNLEAARNLEPEWKHQAEQDPERAESGDRLRLLLGRLALLVGDYQEAETHFSEATFSPLDMIHLRLLEGHLEEALQLIQQTLTSFPIGKWSLERHLALTWLGIVESRNGQLETAARRLETEVQVFREKGMFFWLAGAELHLAWALMQLGQEIRATTHIESALVCAANIPTTYFAFWHPDVIAFACDVAEKDQIQTDYVANQLRPCVTLALDGVSGLRSQNETSQKPATQHDASPPGTTPTQPGLTILKRSSALQLIVEQGLLSPQGITKLLGTYHLTPRETEVFVCYVSPDIRMGNRRVNQAIADRLFLSELTVRAHISAILKKLDLPGRNRLWLRSWAIHEGIIPE